MLECAHREQRHTEYVQPPGLPSTSILPDSKPVYLFHPLFSRIGHCAASHCPNLLLHPALYNCRCWPSQAYTVQTVRVKPQTKANTTARDDAAAAGTAHWGAAQEACTDKAI